MKRRDADAPVGPRPLETPDGDSDKNAVAGTDRKATASAGLKRIANAFRRAAISDETPTAPESPAVEDRTVEPPDIEAARDDGRKPGWPWPSTVTDVRGKLASKLRPEASIGEVRRGTRLKWIPRTLTAFAVGLVIGWIVVNAYTIPTEFQDVRAANSLPPSPRPAASAVTGPDQPLPPVQSAPTIHESPTAAVVLAERGDDQKSQAADHGNETAEVPVVIPDVPLSLVVGPASGGEDTAIPLAISTTRAGEGDGAGLSITIAGLPEGARLSAGRDEGGGTWILSSNELEGLTLRPPADYSGRFELSVAAAVQSAGGASETATTPLVVYVSGVADPPNLETQDARGRRDRPIPLSIAAATADYDGSESLSIVISGMPEGAALSSGADRGEDGWALTRDQLDGLTLRPPAKFTGRLELAVAATALEADGDRTTTTAPLAVRVTSGTNHLILRIEDARGDEGSPVPLDINASLAESDGSEHLSVVVTDLPEGASLSAGRRVTGGDWTLAADELIGLSLLPPSGYSGRFQLRIAATVRQSDGNVVTATAPLEVEVTRTPQLSLEPELPEPADPVPELVAPAQAAPAQRTAADEPLTEAAEALRALKGAPVVHAEPTAAEEVEVQQAQTNPDARAYMTRGDKLMALGDVAAARLFYELAVEHGSTRAVTAMAKTYDPVYLKEQGVLGVRGDSDKAMAWYKRAVAAGDGEAARRLEALNR